MAFAHSEFELGAPQKVDGLALRVHLEAIQRRTGIPPDALANAPTLPDGCEQLWRDFLALHNSRGSSGFGPSRITYADLEAFQRVEDVRLPAWQIDAIRGADGAFMTVHAAQNRRSHD